MGYLLFDKKEDGQGYCKGFSNMRLVSEFTGISYSTLSNHFIRERRVWHYYKDKGIMVIHFHDVEKGKQRVQRGPGKHNRNI